MSTMERIPLRLAESTEQSYRIRLDESFSRVQRLLLLYTSHAHFRDFPYSVVYGDLGAAPRRALAMEFADRVRDSVVDVRLTQVAPHLEVTVLIPDLNVEHELSLRREFIEAMHESRDRSLPELRVYAVGDSMPDRVTDGEPL